MSKKTVMVDNVQGVFLGVAGSYALFAKNNVSGVYRAYGFESIPAAQLYAASFLTSRLEHLRYEEVETSADEYVHVIDLIKAGLSVDVYDMMSFAPMISNSIH